jgi:hypothetical protein
MPRQVTHQTAKKAGRKTGRTQSSKSITNSFPIAGRTKQSLSKRQTSQKAISCLPEADDDELPVYDFRAPVGRRTGPHNRPIPYDPTPQKALKYKYERGNPPEGVEEWEWADAFNNADTKIYNKAKGREGQKKKANEIQYKARVDGTTRDKAIDRLIETGILPDDYQDLYP